MYDLADLEIKTSTYDWCVKAFSVLEQRLGLNVKFHHEDGRADSGQIFLFNHFARFETIIPPYLIHKETGSYCRSVATKDLFAGGGLSRFLMNVGAVPNDLPGLLPFLAAETLRGRKVVVFPEGGMVKDRRTLDHRGQYGIYSRTAGRWRKHHAGAAVIALVLEIFKSRILSVKESGNQARLERWVKSLRMENVGALLDAAGKPTLIVPANIAFYPIRISDNVLRRGVDFFVEKLGKQFEEELLIEGNILLKNTDMDIRFGPPIAPQKFAQWWEARAIDVLFENIDSLDDLFSLNKDSGKWIERFVSTLLHRKTSRLRDTYMRGIYAEITVNLAHLASTLILAYVDRGRMEVSRAEFHRTLYLAIKYVQQESSIHLHRFLENPEAYEGVDTGFGRGLDEFWASASQANLIERLPDIYRFLPKLCEEHGFDEIRLENPIVVYANEVAPLGEVNSAIDRALETSQNLEERTFAAMRFDDEIKRHAWCRRTHRQPRHAEINALETATIGGEPYFLEPERPNGMGVVLAHGFLASPAELLELGKKFHAAGYTVVGVRLEGHGTSPWDLRDREWEDWLESIRRGYRILAPYVDRIVLVGFSTGGSLVLQLAAEQPEKLLGVVSISAPVKFRNRNLIFVPLLHGANTITRWIPSLEGVMPFQPNPSEHPDVNYGSIPVRGLYELRQTVDALLKALPNVSVPTLVVHGRDDPVIDASSAKTIVEGLGSEEKQIEWVEASRHGIVYENIGGCQQTILSFVDSLRAKVAEIALAS